MVATAATRFLLHNTSDATIIAELTATLAPIIFPVTPSRNSGLASRLPAFNACIVECTSAPWRATCVTYIGINSAGRAGAASCASAAVDVRRVTANARDRTMRDACPIRVPLHDHAKLLILLRAV